MGFEPMTSSLPRKCSTPELRRLIYQFTVLCLQFAYQCCQLPTANRQLYPERKTRFELATYSLEGYRSTNWATSALMQFAVISLLYAIAYCELLTANYKVWGEKDSNLRSRSNGFTVRPIWPLWYPPNCYSGPTMLKVEAKHRNPKKQSLLSGSNQWPTDYKSVALPAELRRLKNSPLFLLCSIAGHRIFTG